jgi:hypothetical protein
MTYIPNIPQANDDLDDSQPQILGNFQAADASFGKDHYAFSNLTTNNGFHNIVTQPAYVEVPPTGFPPTTTSLIARIYAFQQTMNLGVLQYSRGPSSAVPTPITNLQSPSTYIALNNGQNTPVLDFSGLNNVVCKCIAVNNDTGNWLYNESLVTFDGTNLTVKTISSNPPTVTFVITGSTTLQVRNSSGGSISKLEWNVQFLRIL